MVSCAVYDSRVPALFFEPGVVSRFARPGAGFDVDLYVLGEEDEDRPGGRVTTSE